MYWHQQTLIAQAILLNFQELVTECIQHTAPDKDYFVEKIDDDFYFSTKIPFPMMNGIVSVAHEPGIIAAKCQKVKEVLGKSDCPITWFWPHDMDLPTDVLQVFKQQGFTPVGQYTSVATEANKIRNQTINTHSDTTIELVKTEQQFSALMEITKVVFGMPDSALTPMARLYSAYKHTNKLKLYIALVEGSPVGTLVSFHFKNTLGLYNGATLEAYRKHGILTSLVFHAVTKAEKIDYVVSQLMAAQIAKGVADQLGFNVHSHFTPLCYGVDLSGMQL